jgi:hypothetical protein
MILLWPGKDKMPKIANGMHGCVYSPAVPCPDGTSTEQFVTKIVKKEKLQEELNPGVFSKLLEIDADETYVIRNVSVETVCHTQEQSLPLTADVINECPQLSESGQQLGSNAPRTREGIGVLYSKYAGNTTLSKAIYDDMDSQGLVFKPPVPSMPPRFLVTKTYTPSALIKKLIGEVLKVHQFLIGNNLFHGDIGFSNVMVVGETVKFIDMDSIKPIQTQEGYLEAAKQNIMSSGISQLKGFQPFTEERGGIPTGGRRKTRRRKQKRRRTKARK